MEIRYKLLMNLGNFQNEEFEVKGDLEKDYPGHTLQQALVKVKEQVLSAPWKLPPDFAKKATENSIFVPLSEIEEYLDKSGVSPSKLLAYCRLYGEYRTLGEVKREDYEKARKEIEGEKEAVL